jgi:predicted pyridoxine 5'-phosphate oxidase superfamily flavin-nucleotide-binding protein
MTRKTTFLVWVFAFLFLGSLAAQAGPLPEWAWKGESYMNKKRTNTTYEFKVFKTEDAYLSRLQESRFYPLLVYLGEQYGVDPSAMALDSLSNRPGEPFTYRIAIPMDGETATAWAQRVDVYSATDYNTTLDPFFEYYQLYAVSVKGVDPVFDTFERGERSRGKAALMNFLPGTGQLYKGHSFKGYVLLGSEVALGVTALTQQIKANYYDKMAETATVGVDSYRNDAIARRRIRNAAFCAMAGAWAFSVVDALITESMPNITVSAPQNDSQLTIAPASQGAGIALVYRF